MAGLREFVLRHRATLIWALVGGLVGISVHLANLIGAFRSESVNGLTLRPGAGGWVAYKYLIGLVFLTPFSLLVAALLAIVRPLRPFAVGALVGVMIGAVVVSVLAHLVIPDEPLFG